MITVRVLRLGTVCVDRATGLEGTLTHWTIDMDRSVHYLFQPRGLNEDGQPVQKLFLGEKRLDVKPEDFEDVDVPFEILGTQVTSKASGFKGMAVDFVRHMNGCFHVTIQPKGLSPKTGAPIKWHDFDLRECSGDKITELSKPELEKSKKEQPSPTGDTMDRDLPPGLVG